MAVEDRPGPSDSGADMEPTRTVPPESVVPARPLPKQIGHYRIKRFIGSGGMGTVYEAVQEHPRRTVALKVMKPGIASRSALRRFEYESQILARLRHPAIAQVYEAGTHDEGEGSVPYFVMEYIPNARSITDYAKARRLSTRDRLALFVRVCDAVQHGHQKGIIHRDLKPGNILVDSNGDPKIIDFGVARATDSDLVMTTLQTQVGQLVGTLQYMSPEQIEADPHDIDVRSDVYSLGVVLFELLSGQLPYDVSRAAVLDAARIIRDQPPTRLSTADSTLRGDVETIVLGALQKDRGRRYQSAEQLRQDIVRYLNNEPIEARAPSITYRLTKFVRRHRVVVAGAVVILVVLVAATLVSASLAVRARRAERDAQRRLVEKEREADKAHAVIEFLGAMLTSADPEIEGQDVRVVDVLEGAERQLRDGAVGQPEVEAAVRAALGKTHRSLGRLEEAEAHLRAALEIRTGVLGDDHLDVAESLYDLGFLLKEQGRLEEAAALYRRSLEIRRRHLGDEDALVAHTMHNLGVALQLTGEVDAAESFLRGALAVTRRRPGDNELDRATTMTVLGELLRQQGRFEEAESLHREALSIYRQVHGEDHVHVARALSNLASTLQETDRLEEAERLARRALEIRRAEFGPRHVAVASSLVRLARILIGRGAYDEAEPLVEEAVAIYRQRYGESHSYVAATLLERAAVLEGQGKGVAAEEAFVGVIGMFTAAHGSDHWLVANARSRYGVCLTRLGRHEEAERELLIAHEILAEKTPTRAGVTASRLADLYEVWERDDEAARWRSLVAPGESAPGD